MPKLSVLVPCKNEEHHIRDCIASFRELADEIVVADSGSSDRTLENVRALGDCRLIEREFVNFADFKNWAIPQCTHDWVLIVDADERVTPELAVEIRKLLSDEPACDAYWIRRENIFLGRTIRYSGWNNDRVLRLVRREACRYLEKPVHEEMSVSTGKIGVLQSKLKHDTCRDLASFTAKVNHYTSLGADYSYARGKRMSLPYALAHVPLRFLQQYVLRLGVLDGFPGFVICGLTALDAFLKDAKLWEANLRRENAELQSSSPHVVTETPRKSAA